MKEAACSWRTRTYLISEASRVSTRCMFSSPGMPKTYSTPSFSRQRTINSAAVCLVASLIFDITHLLSQAYSGTTSPRGLLGVSDHGLGHHLAELLRAQPASKRSLPERSAFVLRLVGYGRGLVVALDRAQGGYKQQ